VLQKVSIQNWIHSKWVSGSQDMDLLVEKMHCTRFNAINKPEIISARKRFCKLDKCISKLTKLHLATFMHLFILFGN
jgi:hypothetical protein